MFAEERRRLIVDLVNNHGSVRLAELVQRLEVTEPTLRKDLSRLESQRLLKRTHGGAIAVRAVLEPDLTVRDEQDVAAKDAIARACASMVADGDAIYIDSGTTTVRIAQHLAGKQVNVLTNAFGVALTLADEPGIRHTVLGGQYRSLGGSFVGTLALRALRGFTVNTAFIGVTGIAVAGASVADLSEAELKAAVMDQARRVVVPMASAKVGVLDFALVATLDRIDCVVTESADESLRQLCSENNIELVVADPNLNDH